MGLELSFAIRFRIRGGRGSEFLPQSGGLELDFVFVDTARGLISMDEEKIALKAAM